MYICSGFFTYKSKMMIHVVSVYCRCYHGRRFAVCGIYRSKYIDPLIFCCLKAFVPIQMLMFLAGLFGLHPETIFLFFCLDFLFGLFGQKGGASLSHCSIAAGSLCRCRGRGVRQLKPSRCIRA